MVSLKIDKVMKRCFLSLTSKVWGGTPLLPALLLFSTFLTGRGFGEDVFDIYLRVMREVEYNKDHDREYWDRVEYWQTPEETVLIGKGDCEDISVYMMNELREEGIASELVVIEGNGVVHTLVLIGDRIYDPSFGKRWRLNFEPYWRYDWEGVLVLMEDRRSDSTRWK